MAEEVPKPRRKSGPPVTIDIEKIKAMASINCSTEEIAGVLGCSIASLYRYKKLIDEGRMNGRSSLKRRMWQCAMGFTEVKAATFKVKRKHLKPTADGKMVIEEEITEERQALPIEVTYEPNVGMQMWLSKQMLGYREPEQAKDPQGNVLGSGEPLKITWISEARPGEQPPNTEEKASIDDPIFDQNG